MEDDFTDLDPAAALEAAEYERLIGQTVQDILREGQKALFAKLVALVRSGKANHQEMAILRNILKDNGLTLGIPPETPEEAGPAAPLPSYEDPDYR